MIKNDRQYQLTRAEVRRFEQALAALITGPSDSPDLREVEIAAVRSQLQSMQHDVAEYEALRGSDNAIIAVASFEDLPRALIKARIMAGLSQRQLAERLRVKEQQIQRYEAADYAGASLARIQAVADALGVRVHNEVELSGEVADLRRVKARLVKAGVDSGFIDRRLLPRKEWSAVVVADLISRISRVFHVSVDDLLGADPLQLALQPALTPSFKVPASANERRVVSHALFARYLAELVIRSTPTLQTKPIPSDWTAFRKAVLQHFGEFTFEGVLSFLWQHGIAVVPLSEPGGFHAAYWRISGRDVVVVKQSTRTTARWLFDVLHESYHAATSSELDRVVIEEWDDEVDAADDDEVKANTFAGDVIFDGQAENLASEAVEEAGGRLENLKAATSRVAARRRVSVGALANYLAWRLSLQGESWWAVAHNLQEQSLDPWAIARDQLLLHIDPSQLQPSDFELLSRALEEVDA